RSGEPCEPHSRLHGEHGHDVGARIAGVADAVAVTVVLRRVRRRRAIVQRVAEPVAVAVWLPRVVRAVRGGATARLGDVALGRGVAAHGPGGHEGIGRAVVGDAVARLVEIAVAGGGPACRGALHVGGAVDARAIAVFLEVADAGRGAARGAGSGDVIDGTIVGDAVADLVDVAAARGGPADGGALGVRGAVDARTVAVLLEVAHAGRETAGGARHGDVVGGALVGDAVADLVDVADARGGPADVGALVVGRAVDGRAVAVLLEVADAGREPARRAGGDDVVGRTAVADTVAALRHVADTGRGPADRRALRIVRARGARPGACLGDVADAGGRTTRGTAGDEAVGRTAVADAVAALGDVADASGGPADRRALGIIRARGARPGAGLRDVAEAGGRATGRTAGDEAVGRAAVADPVAALGQVADTSRAPADGRALGVVRARGARPRARLRDVADAG